MNKKGFTLIELMAVIILLGVLSLIATVTINNTLKENKESACEIQVGNIKAGAENWASKNVFDLPNENGGTVILTLKELKDAGFIDKDIKNPKTNELFDDSIQIKITKVDNSYTYEVGVEC
ncbi:MAG: type II secretion system protein [Bacilli bacterium]|nr:type II secretion system protein [Bacilli bacterium]